jgi:hypothetical protein
MLTLHKKHKRWQRKKTAECHAHGAAAFRRLTVICRNRLILGFVSMRPCGSMCRRLVGMGDQRQRLIMHRALSSIAPIITASCSAHDDLD